jgi:ribonuclease HI
MTQVAVVHADESCLGNGREGTNPGGAGVLIEIRVKDRIERFDVFLSAPASTNNRMALSGAVATFALLSRKGRRLTVAYVSDSEYLVKGMREWLPGWRARGWTRKAGPIENLELWQALAQVAEGHDVRWMWVRGHAGDPKNEYADHLAVRAARDQVTSEGAAPSGFLAWLEQRRARGQFRDFDPDAAFASVAAEAVR